MPCCTIADMALLRRPRHRTAALAAALTLLAAGAVVAAGPAVAHESDPRVVHEVVGTTGLPDDVVVQAQPSLAAQLVADNPTSTPLEVLDDDGRPFLRLSSAGVEADVASAAFLGTASPSGVVPPGAATDEPRWVRISAGSSWGWFDHRLHPDRQGAPPDPTRAVELDRWRVPLRYGADDAEVRGLVRFVPLLGGFVVRADPAPEGLTVQALPGRLPALLVANPGGRAVTVLGADGEPFLRFTAAGLQVNEASRTHVEDRRARGLAAGVPGPEPRFTAPDPAATSWTWLDARLRYPAALPPDDVVERGQEAVVERWSVPVEVDGERTALTGEVRWVPDPALAAVSGSRAPGGRAAVVTAAAVAVLAAAVVALRRRRAR